MCEKVLFLTILFICVTSSYGKFRYDYVYNKNIKGWLKVHNIPAPFKDAVLTCDMEGAMLASPINGSFKRILSGLLPNTTQNCAIYTGIHSTISHGVFTTIDGLPIERIPIQWAPDEPDNYENREECVIMLPEGMLADVKCNETFPFVCYKEKTKNLVMTECGTIDPDYKLDKRTGNCYKFHRIGTSWKLAQRVCHAEGGYLAIINNITEAQVIKDLFAQNPANTIVSRFRDSASIGFLEWIDLGLWHTVHGQKLQDTEYYQWSNGQPDDARIDGNNTQDCGGIFRTGLLDDVWCTGVNMAFICEKEPESLATNDEADD